MTYQELQDEIQAAKDRHYREDLVLPPLVDTNQVNIETQLIDNLILIRTQKYNTVLLQLAIMRKFLLEEKTTTMHDLWYSEQETMKYLAQVFEDDPLAILHLRNVSPSMFRSLNKGKKKALLKNQKRQLEIHEAKEDTTERTGKKRRINDHQETQEYIGAFLDEEIEFQNGLWNFGEGSGSNLENVPSIEMP
jgi:hypothetical protein